MDIAHRRCPIALVNACERVLYWAIYHSLRGFQEKNLHSEILVVIFTSEKRWFLMSYLSCDFGYKISASGAAHSTGKNSNQYNRGPRDNHRGIKGYFQYLCREIDVANGNEIYGYHESIDKSKTMNNETYFRDSDAK